MLLLRVNKSPFGGFFETGLGGDHTTWPRQVGLSWKKKEKNSSAVQEVMRFMFPAAGLF